MVEAHHYAAGIELPNATVHAVFHAIVENQIAEDLAPVVRTLARLRQEGLSRYDAIHPIGSVLAEHLCDAMQSTQPGVAGAVQGQYEAAV